MADIPISLLRFTPPMTGNAPSLARVGRPDGPREQLVVPGQPRAAENRPANALGRIPVGTSTSPAVDNTSSAPPFDIDAIQREVESSKEYQALKNAGYIKENPLHENRRLSQASENLYQRIEEDGYQKLRGQLSQRATQQIDTSEFNTSSAARQMNQQATQAIEEGQAQRADPLALDLNGNGLQTTGIANGVQFDINADGRLDQTSFISGGDAFLALDANANGRIDDGRELFGDQNGDTNGYLALARIDDNSDGVINRDDAVFQQLRLFTQSSDGTQQLRTLEEGGIASLSLGYKNSDIALNQYDTIAQLSSFERTDGSTGESGDLLLGYKTPG